MLIRHIARSASKGLSSRRASKALAGVAGSRPATTLTEVLVAIFVMAIGLMALLTLFPLGALSMAQAIKDDRTAHGGRNATAVATIFNIHDDAFLFPQPSYQYPQIPVISDAYLNPYPVPPPGVGMPALNDPTQPWYDPTKPSYPVYVDPYAYSFLGFNAQQVIGQTVGNTGGIGIPRRWPAFLAVVNNNNQATILNQRTIRWFTLLDDINNFQDTALPALAPTAPAFLYPPPINTTGQNVIPTIQRENRYSSAYMLRRPKSGDPTVVDMSVVVYSGRSLSVLGESVYSGIGFNPSLNYVDVPYAGGQVPSIRRGSWILDATVVIPTNPPQPDPHGFFYRVVEVTDLGGALRLELQTTPKAASYYGPVGAQIPYGVLIVMDNVAEVFDKGQGWKP